ncbi:nucleoside deaminase [Corynebacterium jeddahense]|uniref:tRNA-specific adenosine deaminase n=1 Tax=Corynebacterium jeddahense TaxID=1414719 RepID=A0ABY7UG89_9CORY|nr:nucleoside deaminase [Corynebacterium jeddahense]WCZ37750.1 tRNA-specific adenosine deaminase [Corynebacterium jeddahense]
MREAMAVAARTPAGDVPVGAVVFDAAGNVVGRGVNRREANCDPTAHAEVEAIRDAARTLGTWRLDGCELVVTLEPCTMCAGAILGARVSSLVFGAWEPKTGAVGSVLDAIREPRHLHAPEVRGGVLEAETVRMLGEFFEGVRSN